MTFLGVFFVSLGNLLILLPKKSKASTIEFNDIN